ncbi:MAG: hypothetical protein LBE20_00400 [Deltaproteobacteria bacterium]|jgi:cell division protein FtsB|nr:hypothetical protein [Deltaproteobacteria bacterium]
MSELFFKIAELLERIFAFVLGYKFANNQSELQRQQELTKQKKEAEIIAKHVNSLSDAEVIREAKKYERQT